MSYSIIYKSKNSFHWHFDLRVLPLIHVSQDEGHGQLSQASSYLDTEV